METKNKRSSLLNISRKTFIQVALLLLALMAVSIVMTYVVPRGEFGVLANGETNYLDYIRRDDLGGIPLLHGILAPVLVFFSSDGLSLLMLSLFLCVVSASFQIMSDAGGILALVGSVSRRFGKRRRLLLVMMSLLFYCFGSFLGLFEEMLTMLPIVAALCVFLGYDSFTGFICCILACGFGFAGAITNPFTVILASEIIGADPMAKIWFRILIFLVMFALLMAFLFLYLKRLKADPSCTPTLRHDETLRESSELGKGQIEDGAHERKLRRTYTVFLLCALVLVVASSLIPALRSYTVVVLLAYFLIFGLIAGSVAFGNVLKALASFGHGLLSALPTVVFIALAASIKYIFERGAILPTIIHQINGAISGYSPIRIALFIYLIVLLLEFFISSSTAKAILIMGLLGMVNTGLSKQMLVLLYTFGDGYTNVLFPTSPVLLISLSMIEMNYFKWIRKSWALFAVNFLLVIGFIVLGVVCGY